jgi:hypothetical protein
MNLTENQLLIMQTAFDYFKELRSGWHVRCTLCDIEYNILVYTPH